MSDPAPGQPADGGTVAAIPARVSRARDGRTERGRVAGKVALVTGAGSGIGKEISLLLASEGARLVMTSKPEPGLDDAFHEVETASGSAILGLPLDVTDRAAVEAAVRETVQRHGRIDILSNNAAIELVHSPSIVETRDEEWERVLAVNLTGVFYTCRAAIPAMPPGGSIINMGSLKSLEPRVNAAAYTASKAALLQFTRALALELGPSRIRANCVCPGTIETPLTQAFLVNADDPAALREEYAAKSVLHRIGTPREVANCVLFLASDEASFVTGTTFVVDGGALLK